MKKKLILFTLLAGSCLSLGACNLSKDKDENKQENQNETKIEEQNEEDKLVLEPNTPQSWIDLFTFTNVTITLKNNVTIKRGDEYRCVDGKWYVKRQGEETFSSHNGRYIFDLYLSNYSKFTWDEEYSSYRASGWAADESGYLREIAIAITEGKITEINDVAALNSSEIVSNLKFFNYGSTTLTD